MTTRTRTFLFAIVKWLLFAVVLIYVCRKAVELSDTAALSRISLKPMWLVASAVLYLVGWLPSVWFWQRLMAVLGASPPFSLTIKGYYFGHLGKYVPGKVAAILVRATTLQSAGVPIGVSILTAMIETPMVMGVGLALAIGCAPFLLPISAWQAFPASVQVLREHVWLGPIIAFVGTLIAVPIAAEWILRFAARKTRQRLAGIQAQDLAGNAAEPSASFSRTQLVRLLLIGVVAFLPTWFAQGLSLGCLLLSMGTVDVVTTRDWLLWTGAIGAGNSLGFFVLFAPGGLGVREGILIACLAPTAGNPAAVAASGLLRLVWLAAELLAAGALWLIEKLKRSRR